MEREAMRNMALPTTESSMSLRILDAMVGVVGAIPGIRGKYYTPEITKVKFHRDNTENPMDISSGNPLEN